MTPTPIAHPDEPTSNATRAAAARVEPRALRTFTPTQAVVARSAGVFHWTPEGRRLFDFTSGVLVANLGHNPTAWTRRFTRYMGWPMDLLAAKDEPQDEFFPAVAMTAYNAVTPIESEAGKRLIAALKRSSGGGRMEQVMWAASGSEAIQKALWAALARDRSRSVILATRFGFHGKKGLANAVTGSETDADRDPRVRFIGFPMAECRDVSNRGTVFDPAPYEKELEALLHQFGQKIGVLITEPYLGGGGSYHPPKGYLQLLERFCRANDIVFILDEVQSNFGRTGDLFAFVTQGIEPDIVVLGKGLGNGVPVAAAVGRADLFAALDYGEASDTWSANPLNCAAVLATLDEFESRDVLAEARVSSAIIETGLVALKRYPFVAHVRGEHHGMVWGVEMRDHAGKTAQQWASEFVLACYHGDGSANCDGVHLLGPLAKKVVRVSPPLVITPDEARVAMTILDRAAGRLADGQPAEFPHAHAR
ncbi:aspartate aminotransferase family protein [Fimbriiglobus ruber]|uniref:Acetylornithine aminotransferase n=1 Tax=Fimbriiglobus ruber TaxID=1908690 RepID=A0A225E0J0_9BACT|nr:aminotransferase class III-fold pyridoxal phosphate-dependent enzyme [Fimbriiglobus ruber]OWK47250.1 Acetylornithine aminotransferase [Fimbriiglobus ruber]